MSKLQDLIVQYFNEDKDKKIFDQIINELQTCDTVWSAFSPITKNHFVDYVQGRPTAFLFSEQEYCKQYCNHMKQSGFTVGSAECSKENRLSMFADYHRSGFECIIIDNGKRYLVIELSDLINIPDYSEIPLENRPVINPDLVCSADRFFQCLESKTLTPDKEINLLIDTYNAKYVIPIQGEITNNTANIPALERSDGLKVVPFFTDIAEYRKYDGKGKYKPAMADYTQIESFCNAGETVVINPLGFNFTLNKKTIDAVHNALNAVPKGGKTDRAVIFTPEKVPAKLIDGLSPMLDITEGVNAAYIKGLRKNNESSLLLIVDCGESDAETTKLIMDAVKERAEELADGEKIEYITAASGIGKTAVAETEPFFERITIDASLAPENVD